MSNRPLGTRQREVIRRLQAGDTLHWMSGLHAYAFWVEPACVWASICMHGSLDNDPVNSVIFSLEDRGLIVRERNARNQWRVRLTPKGWDTTVKDES